MSADDQAFLDMLSSVSSQLRQYTDTVADYIDHNVDRAANVVRDSLSSSTWLPDILRPQSPPATSPVAVIATTRLDRAQSWLARHKLLTGAAVLAVGAVAYQTYRSAYRSQKSRRAKWAKNGGRMDVIVIAGSPSLPLTRALAMDMERRYFIVYITCSSLEEEEMVHDMSRRDIRPLAMDPTQPTTSLAMEQFAHYLQSPHSPVPKAKPNYVFLKAVLLIPSLSYESSPIATIPPSRFADLFNTHLLDPILTIQAFLPLLTSRPSRTTDSWSPPKVLVFTPAIIAPLNPPFHAPEATVCSALAAFTEVLAAELRPLSIPVTHMQLGTFDFTGFAPARGSAQSADLIPTTWPEPARHAYAKNFIAQSGSAISRIKGVKGSSLARLHDAVFDVIDGSNSSRVIRIGLGSSVYGFVGRWTPRSLVTWMMGIRPVQHLHPLTNSYDNNRTGSEVDQDWPSDMIF